MLATQFGALRAKHGGMSQQKLADMLGETQSTVTRLESGEQAVKVSDIFRIAAALDCPPITLLSGGLTGADVPATPKLSLGPQEARRWIAGRHPLEGADQRFYAEAVSDDEARARREAPGLLHLLMLVDDYEQAVIDGNLDGRRETLDSLANV